MGFYSSMSSYYDLIFPVSPDQEKFFGEIVRDFKPVRILDAACGSGNQLLCFAKRGLSCAGFDADGEMVDLARRKLAGYAKAEVKEGKFHEMATLFPPGFDLLMNLGNSLVHVQNREAEKFISDAAHLLNECGILLIQILNYDRILANKIEELPPIHIPGVGLSFNRSYTFTENEKLRFETKIEVPSENISISSSLPLYPLKKDDLLSMVKEAGLSLMGLFPGFSGKKFKPDSEALVLMAKK